MKETLPMFAPMKRPLPWSVLQAAAPIPGAASRAMASSLGAPVPWPPMPGQPDATGNANYPPASFPSRSIPAGPNGASIRGDDNPRPYYGSDPIAPLGQAGIGPSITDPLPEFASIPRMELQAPIPSKRKHKGMFPGKDWKTWAGIIGDAMIAYGGGAPVYGPMRARQLEQKEERNFLAEKLAMELEAKRQERLHPKVEQVGNTIGMFDPGALSYNPIFTAPQPFEIYARSLGYEPGTQEYIDAIEDYRAGTWGDEGVAGRLTVQRPRLEQSDINNRRSTGVSRENNIRSTSTSRGNNIRSTGQSDANSLRTTNQSNVNSERTDQRVRDSAGFRGRGGRGNAATAVGPDGRRIVVRNGRWVDAQTGRPVQ